MECGSELSWYRLDADTWGFDAVIFELSVRKLEAIGRDRNARTPLRHHVPHLIKFGQAFD